MLSHFDVIIIGARCAGASLAIHLAKQGMKILIVDRASFPSLPSVPSTPLIHPGTMHMMDELNIPESAYAHPGSKIKYYATVVDDKFQTVIPTSRMKLDRNYFYGGDRVRFDNALWSALARYPNVTALDCFAATAILRDAHGTVIGIRGKSHYGYRAENFTADLVVGADGRFSFAAREFGARVLEERNEHTTASYHAEWEGVAPYSAQYKEHTFTLYNNLRGVLSLFIPLDDRKFIVSLYVRSDYAHFGGHRVQESYLHLLQSCFPAAWKRLEKAQRLTPVVGVRKIENGYREAFGSGWALVGDALHYKDPIDGQGIYDALVEAKLLAEEIGRWKQEGGCWCDAGQRYQARVMAETYPMFNETMANVERRFYTEAPSKLKIQTMLRWMLVDPLYQAYTFKYLSRALIPGEMPPSNRRVIVRGILRDISGGLLFNR